MCFSNRIRFSELDGVEKRIRSAHSSTHPPQPTILHLGQTFAFVPTLTCVKCTYKQAKATLAACLVTGGGVIPPLVCPAVYLCTNFWGKPDISPEAGPITAVDATVLHCDFALDDDEAPVLLLLPPFSPLLPFPSTSSADCNAPIITRSRFTNTDILITKSCRPRPTTHIPPRMLI